MDSETVPLEDSLNSPQDNPEQMLIDQETVAAFLQDIHETLSPMENKVPADCPEDGKDGEIH